MPDATHPDATSPPSRDYHPVYLNSRREAAIVLGVWFVAMIWAVPWCYLNGYHPDGISPDEVSTVWGIPSWIFWGIVAPWLVADVFTVWFCFAYMQDDDLGEAHEGLDLREEIEEIHARQHQEEQS